MMKEVSTNGDGDSEMADQVRSFFREGDSKMADQVSSFFKEVDSEIANQVSPQKTAVSVRLLRCNSSCFSK